MKKYLLPIGGALLMIALSILLNHSVQASGIVTGGLVGFGAGYALNYVFSKVKKDKENAESK